MTPLSGGLREAIARALHHDWHSDEEWDAIPDSVSGYYRRLADVTLALPELAALRAKADAADRVRKLVGAWDGAAREWYYAHRHDTTGTAYACGFEDGWDHADQRLRAALEGDRTP